MFTDVSPVEIYGDESCGLSAISYGVIAFPAAMKPNIDWRLAATKQAFGGGADTRIHCAELFNEKTRAAGPWEHLSRDNAFELLERLAKELVALKTQVSVVHYLRSEGPVEGVPRSGAEDDPILSGASFANDKAIAIMLAAGAVAPFMQVMPNNPLHFFPDPDGDSKIPWNPKPRRVGDILEGFWFGLGQGAPTRLSIKRVGRPKPAILDVADMLAYAAQKATMPSSETTERFAALLASLNPTKAGFHPAREGDDIPNIVIAPNAGVDGG